LLRFFCAAEYAAIAWECQIFLKTDVYHIVADLTGMHDLPERGRALLGALARWLFALPHAARRAAADASANVLLRPRREAVYWITAGYALVHAVGIAGSFVYLFLYLLPANVAAVRGEIHLLASSLAPWQPLRLLDGGLALGLQSLFYWLLFRSLLKHWWPTQHWRWHGRWMLPWGREAGRQGGPLMTTQRVLSAALAIALGGVFLASATPKLRDPRAFVLGVLDYDVVPPALGSRYGWVLPPIELFVALLLLTGTAVRAAAMLALLLLLSFLVGVGHNLARGRDLDCHCFGPAVKRRIGWGILAQDLALLLAAGSLAALMSEQGWLQLEVWSLFWLLGVAGSVPLVIGTCVVAAGATAIGLRWLTPARWRAWVGARRCTVFRQRLAARTIECDENDRGGAMREPSSFVAAHPADLAGSVRDASVARDGRKRGVRGERDATHVLDGAEMSRLIPPAAMPALVAITANGFGTLDLQALAADGPVLVVCLSPLCPGCQALVGPLNALAADRAFRGQIVILLGAQEPSCRSFASVFPIYWPLICDQGRAVMHALGVERTPMGLQYDGEGMLARREQITSPADLRALFG